MGLAEFIQQFPGLSLANESDNQEILAIFDQAPMGSNATVISYRRSPDFFKLLNYRGGDNYTFVYRGQDQRIKGVGSLNIKSAMMASKAAKIGTWSDLRFKSMRFIYKHWREVCEQIMSRYHEIEELKDIDCFCTSILDSNQAAKKSFLGLNIPYTFKPYCQYNMVNVLGRLPFNGHKSGLRIEQGSIENFNKIKAFYRDQQLKIELGSVDGSKLIDYRLEHWDQFVAKNFIAVFDQENIVAITAPYDPSAAKSNIVEKLSMPLHLFSNVVAPFRKILRIKKLELKQPLNFLYLSHLTFDHSLNNVSKGKILNGLIHFLYANYDLERFHMIAFADLGHVNLHKSLSGLIYQKEPISLYFSHSRAAHLSADQAQFGFEMTVV